MRGLFGADGSQDEAVDKLEQLQVGACGRVMLLLLLPLLWRCSAAAADAGQMLGSCRQGIQCHSFMVPTPSACRLQDSIRLVKALFRDQQATEVRGCRREGVAPQRWLLRWHAPEIAVEGS